MVKLEQEREVRSRSGLDDMTVEEVVTTLACGVPCDREELLRRTRNGAVKQEPAPVMRAGLSRDEEAPGGLSPGWACLPRMQETEVVCMWHTHEHAQIHRNIQGYMHARPPRP